MYIARHLEQTVSDAANMFGAILVTGPRQVGKTTMLQTVTRGIAYVTLDDPILMQLAIEEAGSFFKSAPPPIFVDEIQRAPNLFPYIKMILDGEKRKGQFFLSGSQHFQMMKNVSESLAGRLGIIKMLGLSLREIQAIPFCRSFIPTDVYYDLRRSSVTPIEYRNVWEIIHRGGMPEMYANEQMNWHTFYGAYTQTYIERDVRDLTQVGDELAFLRFMTVIAAMTGNLLNLASAARDARISRPTAERWLSVLAASGLVYLLQPYSNNIIKRAVKTPKIYFLDTGLAAYLTRWTTPEVLEAGAMSGAFFETFAVSEIIKSYYNVGQEPPIYFYRDRDAKEIDLLIWENGALHPIEIKKTANPNRNDTQAFALLDKIPSMKRGPGGVVCLYDKLAPLQGQNWIIPLQWL
jgi:predicted AAA+ superfamily ATPase